MTFDPDRAAEALRDARRARRPSGPLPSGLAPRDLAEGVALQHALAVLLGSDPPGGFKIGATAKRMQEYLGLSGPAAGFMERRNIHESGVRLSWAELRNPGVECEIGLRLGRSLAPGPCDVAQAADAVADLFPAIEIVENRYGPPPAGDIAAVGGTPTLIGDQVYHAAAVLGTPVTGWRELDLVALPGQISVDGDVRASGRGGDLLGHPMQALAWLASSDVAAAFGGLRAGQVIMLGSVTPPIWLQGPCEVKVVFGDLMPVTLRLE